LQHDHRAGEVAARGVFDGHESAGGSQEAQGRICPKGQLTIAHAMPSFAPVHRPGDVEPSGQGLLRPGADMARRNDTVTKLRTMLACYLAALGGIAGRTLQTAIKTAAASAISSKIASDATQKAHTRP